MMTVFECHLIYPGKKAFNYGKQGRQTVNENIAGMQFMSMAHATKPVNMKPHSWPLQTTADSIM